jgi:hypothetical protein
LELNSHGKTRITPPYVAAPGSWIVAGIGAYTLHHKIGFNVNSVAKCRGRISRQAKILSMSSRKR